MDDSQWVADRFEEHRPRLRAVAYRMLGSTADADDALQDAWVRVRVSRAATDGIDNVGAWLTTVVARVCLNMLRARTTRRTEDLGSRLPDPVVAPEGDVAPEDEAILADSVGLALQIVLDTLPPAERLAFVLHDLFDLPFDEIAPMVGRSSQAARQLASRARRRVRGSEVPTPDPDVGRQRAVVDAFFAAARGGDFESLVTLLDPDVVLRFDGLPGQPDRSGTVRGAEAVARRARLGANPAAELHPALVNGAAGVVITVDGRPQTVMAFTVAGGRVVEIDAIGDPDRVARVAAAFLARG